MGTRGGVRMWVTASHCPRGPFQFGSGISGGEDTTLGVLLVCLDDFRESSVGA